jgi:hypothetical protein
MAGDHAVRPNTWASDWLYGLTHVRQVATDCTLMWQNSGMLTGQVADMVQSVLDKCHHCGRIKRCHVAQSWVATWHLVIGCCCKNVVDSLGVDPRPLGVGERFGHGRVTSPPAVVHTTQVLNLIVKLTLRSGRRRKGLGSSPNLGSMYIHHTTQSPTAQLSDAYVLWR